MMVLWEQGRANEKLLCDTLHLKSNTVTPLLKKLQDKGYIQKSRNPADERNLVITLTAAGQALQERALCVPECIAKEVSLTPQEAVTLYQLLYKVLDASEPEAD